jgi:hypothetical protein
MRLQINVKRGREESELIKMFLYTAKILNSHIYQQRREKKQGRSSLTPPIYFFVVANTARNLVFSNFKW